MTFLLHAASTQRSPAFSLVHEKGIEPHIPVFEKAAREDGIYSRSDFIFDHRQDAYIEYVPESVRFRERATQCRLLAKDAREEESRHTLSDMAEDLDAEANKIDADEAAKQKDA